MEKILQELYQKYKLLIKSYDKLYAQVYRHKDEYDYSIYTVQSKDLNKDFGLYLFENKKNINNIIYNFLSFLERDDIQKDINQILSKKLKNSTNINKLISLDKDFYLKTNYYPIEFLYYFIDCGFKYSELENIDILPKNEIFVNDSLIQAINDFKIDTSLKIDFYNPNDLEVNIFIPKLINIKNKEFKNILNNVNKIQLQEIKNLFSNPMTASSTYEYNYIKYKGLTAINAVCANEDVEVLKTFINFCEKNDIDYFSKCQSSKYEYHLNGYFKLEKGMSPLNIALNELNLEKIKLLIPKFKKFKINYNENNNLLTLISNYENNNLTKEEQLAKKSKLFESLYDILGIENLFLLIKKNDNSYDNYYLKKTKDFMGMDIACLFCENKINEDPIFLKYAEKFLWETFLDTYKKTYSNRDLNEEFEEIIPKLLNEKYAKKLLNELDKINLLRDSVKEEMKIILEKNILLKNTKSKNNNLSKNRI